MAGGKRKRFALDTNLVYDLADGKDFAFTFIEVYQELGYELLVPPTAAQEIAFAYSFIPERRERSKRALTCLRDWGIREFDLITVEHGITEQFSLLLRTKGMIPPEECNDGLILAETSLAEIPFLVTSDRHLLGVDSDDLVTLFAAQHLSSVAVCHPKALLKAVSVRRG